MSGKRIGHRQAGSGRLPKKKPFNKGKSGHKNRDRENDDRSEYRNDD